MRVLVYVIFFLSAALAALWFFDREPAAQALEGRQPAEDEKVWPSPATLTARESVKNEVAPEAGSTAMAGELVGAASYSANGRVLTSDETSVPLCGVSLAEDRDRVAITESDMFGEFSVEVPGGQHLLQSSDESWSTVRAGITSDRSDWLTTIVVAPAIDISGQVVDEGGLAVENAQVQVVVPLNAMRITKAVFRTSMPVDRVVASGVEGRFKLTGVGYIQGATIVASADGFVEDRQPLPAASINGLLIKLARADRVAHASYRVSGQVQHANGTAVAGATVRLGTLNTLSSGEGRFMLRVPRHAPVGTPLVAALEGYRPAIIGDFVAQLRDGDGFAINGVVLQLGGPPLSIVGRVVSKSGEAKPGWHVALWDATRLEVGGGRPPDFVEDLVGDASKRMVMTDDNGRFILTGLLDREYELAAWSEHPLWIQRMPACVPDGDPVQIIVPDDLPARDLTGRVITTRGLPLPDITVKSAILRSGAWDYTHVLGPGPMALSGPSTMTDATGVFSLASVPETSIYLTCSGESIIPGQYRVIDPRDDWSALTLEVAATAGLRVNMGPSCPFDSFRLLDGNGAELNMWIREFRRARISNASDLVLGASAEVDVSEDAEVLVLFSEGTERERRPIELKAGETTIVH